MDAFFFSSLRSRWPLAFGSAFRPVEFGAPAQAARPLRYRLRESFVTAAERDFLRALESVLPPEIRVFAQVRVADLFDVERTVNLAAWSAALEELADKHLDFLLCRADDLSPLLALDLDEKSYDRGDLPQRDEFIQRLFADSGIRLLSVKIQNCYDLAELKLLLEKNLEIIFPSLI